MRKLPLSCVTQDRARVVVVGGGITGCSVAYHLARLGWHDVLLLEKGELTSGSTHHAAGLVTQFNPSPTMMRLRRYSVALYRELGFFNEVGSLRIASSEDSWLDLRRAAGRAEALGLTVDLVGPTETTRLLPVATTDQLSGAAWLPGDGYVDPHIATHAVAEAARELGVNIRTHARVTGIELGPNREVRKLFTTEGAIETEHVVNAGGMWAPQISALVGVFSPSVPVDHQHVLMEHIDGVDASTDLPCFRDPDNLVYGKVEGGGMLVGGYEPNPVSRWVDGVPWEHGSRPVEPDMNRFAPLLQGAIRRFPHLDDAGVIRLLCHPDAMTPDGNPLVGPVPDVRGFWLAAGLSLNGFGGAGGIGKTLAEWMTSGEPEFDVEEYRPWRFGRMYQDTSFADATAREVYRYYYRLRYPLDEPQEGRGRRLSPLHIRMAELGAVFGVKNGWERVNYFRPDRASRRAGEDQREFGWHEPPYLQELAEESAAVRERVGMIDMTSFGKIRVSGRGALALLDRVCDNNIDRPVGSVVYTQFLNPRGGIVGDVTVTRLAEDNFRVVTGAAAVDSDLGWLRLNVRYGDDPVELRDESDELAVIGLWGPRSRDCLQHLTDADLSNTAFPFRTAQTIGIAGVPVLAKRITFVGELGYELYVQPSSAVQIWDRLWRAGDAHSLAPIGYRVLDSLRIEKGYRYFGTDLTPGDTPFEGGVGFCVAMGKDEFVGREALAADPPPRFRLRTLLVGDESRYVTVYGGEAVRRDGRTIGRVRSSAYGFTVRRTVALASVPPELPRGTNLSVDVFGDEIPAVIAADVLHDPEHVRVKG
jgi:4-methylaminobutanoate oxidase (formaldehyde-forming)